jgi:putative tryptophan/tyrosine transport system substrate-binding protein
MRRREFITLLGGAVAAWPLAARAQQAAIAVIGWLSTRSAATDALVLPVFRQALNDQGYVEGRNVRIEYRYADGQLDRLPALAADLVRDRSVAIAIAIGDGAQGARAVQAINAAIPIVGIFGPDPVKEGVVPNLNRPGGNVTGVRVFQSLLVPKRLALLHELLPHPTVLSVLVNPLQDTAASQTSDVQETARTLGLQTHVVNAATERELDMAFASLAQIRPDALFVTVSPFFFSRMNQIVTSVARLSLPASHFRREFVTAGGLMSYASNTADTYRVLGDYAGRILKGEKAGDLPIQQPTKFQLVINLKTAKALGLTIPATLLATADEVIE